ncbi:YidH family protein [Neobacillus drentensis]|jgi:putative membrane protein|uniref:YidH family protein n=1 Tax=Neobacillus drentensis TaxID=220684 RepID=UPI002FFDEE5E
MSNEEVKEQEIKQTVDSKYIQQHLANERTYLAWIRTAIAIIGVGFLVTNLHFNMMSSLSPIGDLLANLIGIASVALGIVTILMATIVYLRKVTTINQQTFTASKKYIITLSILIIFITLLFGAYFLMF